MRKVRVEATTEIAVKNVQGFIQRVVTPFGTGAKVDCPKEYLGKKVYLVILNG